MKQRYDIVINGAGIPGMALALLLAQKPGRQKPSILLLDRHACEPDPSVHQPPVSVDDFDQRVFALTYASKQVLVDAGVWPGKNKYADDAPRVYPYQQMHVWDTGRAKSIQGQIHFDAAEVGTASLGYIVEGRVVQDWLINAIRQEPHIKIQSDDELVACEEQPDHMDITLASNRHIQASLLIGADGAHSKVRELAGIETIGWAYGQQAVVATVETELSHQETAWQRFLPDGPLAFLPMQAPYCSIVWTVSDHRADQLCEMPADEFKQILEQDFEQTLGRIKSIGPRASFPLKLSHARSYTAARIALIADAAHTVHPLAGQGLNLGMLDVAELAGQISKVIADGKDIGARRVLRAYERARKGDNWLMQGSFDGLNRLFSNEQVFLTQLRNTGLNLVDRMTPLKNQFIRKAMGR